MTTGLYGVLSWRRGWRSRNKVRDRASFPCLFGVAASRGVDVASIQVSKLAVFGRRPGQIARAILLLNNRFAFSA